MRKCELKAHRNKLKGVSEKNLQKYFLENTKLSFLITRTPPRLFVNSFIEELLRCLPVVVKTPSNENSQMSAILTVFILLTTENKFWMCWAYFSPLKGNKLRALHTNQCWSLRFSFTTINLRKLIWMPINRYCVIEIGYPLEWQY